MIGSISSLCCQSLLLILGKIAYYSTILWANDVGRDGKVLKIYYSIRAYSRGYYIMYAEQYDGVHWDRLDEKNGIDSRPEKWDDINMSYQVQYWHNGHTIFFIMEIGV